MKLVKLGSVPQTVTRCTDFIDLPMHAGDPILGLVFFQYFVYFFIIFILLFYFYSGLKGSSCNCVKHLVAQRMCAVLANQLKSCVAHVTVSAHGQQCLTLTFSLLCRY